MTVVLFLFKYTASSTREIKYNQIQWMNGEPFEHYEIVRNTINWSDVTPISYLAS